MRRNRNPRSTLQLVWSLLAVLCLPQRLYHGVGAAAPVTRKQEASDLQEHTYRSFSVQVHDGSAASSAQNEHSQPVDVVQQHNTLLASGLAHPAANSHPIPNGDSTFTFSPQSLHPNGENPRTAAVEAAAAAAAVAVPSQRRRRLMQLAAGGGATDNKCQDLSRELLQRHARNNTVMLAISDMKVREDFLWF